jgi:hypothetical protein
VSDTSQGPGWWLASDGKWYPPHLHPSVRVDRPDSWASHSGESQAAISGTHERSRFGLRSKAAVTVAAVLVCLIAGVPVAIALSGGSSRPAPLSAGHRTGSGHKKAGATTTSTPSTSTTSPSSSTSSTTAGPAVAGPPLTAGTAQAVFNSSWPEFAIAFATGDEAGVARYADTDVQDAIAGWFGCGCGPWPTAYQKVFMSAPPETTYPLSFLAEIQERDYSQQPMVVEVVYSKQDAGAAWLISYLVSFIDGPPYLDGSEMDTPAPPSTFDVSIVGSQFASFFQAVFDTGKLPHTWIQTGSMAQETQKVLADRATLKEDHFQETLTYSAGPHSVAFAIPGGDLMCGEIRSHSVLTATGGGPVVQPADSSVFGEELPPGTYASVTSDGLRDACWTATTTGTATPVSFMGGIYSRVGAPRGR